MAWMPDLAQAPARSHHHRAKSLGHTSQMQKQLAQGQGSGKAEGVTRGPGIARFTFLLHNWIKGISYAPQLPFAIKWLQNSCSSVKLPSGLVRLRILRSFKLSYTTCMTRCLTCPREIVKQPFGPVRPPTLHVKPLGRRTY